MLRIYSVRLRVYAAILLFIAAALITPTQFLWAIGGYAVIIYLPVSIVLLVLGSLSGSFKDFDKQRSILGISTPIFCAALVSGGLLLTGTYLIQEDFSIPRFGTLLFFAGLEIYSLYDAARRRRARADASSKADA